MTNSILESAGYRQATDNKKKVLEAVKLFREGMERRSTTAQFQLREAFTTDDFPTLLGAGFELQARTHFDDLTDETQAIVTRVGVPDFEPRKYRDFGLSDILEDVEEGEEYKSSNPFRDTEIEFQTAKAGRVYGFTWEARLADRYQQLAQFPQLLAQSAIAKLNRNVYSVLVEGGDLSEDFFSDAIGSEALTWDNVIAARKELRKQRNHLDLVADYSTMVLVVPPTLEDEANGLVQAGSITETVQNDGSTIERVRTNPLSNIQVVVSSEFANLLGEDVRDTAWALLPGGNTNNPALLSSYLLSHPDLEVRVKRDAGQLAGGGDVPYTEGSFNDDTIWYRGRHTNGVTALFNAPSPGSDDRLVYASTGAGSGS